MPLTSSRCRHTASAARGALAALRFFQVVLFAALGHCGPTPTEPSRVQRLLDGAAPVAIRQETRLASDLGARVVLREHVASLDTLPRSLTLPADVATTDSVVLNYRAWKRLPGRPRRTLSLGQYTEVLEVRRAGRDRTVTPRGLGDFVTEVPVKLVVTALPSLTPQRYVLRSSALMPRRGFLRFGFALREESWVPGASPVRFEVSLIDRSGELHPLFERTLDPATEADQGWFDETVDVTAFGAQEATFQFAATAAGGGEIFLPVWSDPVVYSTDSADERPNVIMVSFDTLRARSLGCYGYARDTSPFIDGVARDGALFENVVTTSATTGPSHMSAFTGRYPPNHGIVRGVEMKLSNVPTLAQLLRDAGYHTRAFTENGFVTRELGFGEGFSEYTENVGEMGVRAPGVAKATFGQARRWLEANRRLPFFLFVHTYQVHYPYNPPSPYSELFQGDGLIGRASPALRPLRNNYDREVRIVDDELRALFGTLEATGLGGSTLVVLLADHGEEFGEHGGFQHGAALFDEVLRVPLVFWGPGRIPAGQRHAGRVSLVDVAPTVLALVGVEIPPSMDGISLRSTITDGAPVRPRVLFGEARAPRRWTAPLKGEPVNPPLIGVVSGNSKFIFHRPPSGDAMPPIGYDLAEDPDELRPFEIPASDLARLTRLVDEYLGGNHSSGGQGIPEVERPAAPLSPEVREKLRLLGYIE